jgi:hypothetical protein
VANTFAPFGFSQRTGTGSSPTYEQIETKIAAATAAIFFGDPVVRLSDGTVAGNTTGPAPGTAILAGIFVGCKWLSVAQKRPVWGNYWPSADIASATTATAYIINDPNAQFTVQVGNSTTTGVTIGNIGMNVQFAYGTGTTSNGLSGAYIDIATVPATTNTLPFRLTGLVSDPPGANGTTSPGAYNWVTVAFNNVETKSLTAQN